MDIQSLGAIGELLSSIATIATLLYLALQVKEARNAIVAQAYQARADMQQDSLLRVAENEDLARILGQVSHGPGIDLDKIDTLPELDRFRVRMHFAALMHRFDNVCFQAEKGYVEPDDLTEMMGSLSWTVPVWAKLGIRLRTAIRRYIEKNGGMDAFTAPTITHPQAGPDQ